MTPSKSLSLKKEWFTTAEENAFYMRKDGYAVVFSFGDGENYYAIPKDLFTSLYYNSEALMEIVNYLGDLGERFGDSTEIKHIKKILRGWQAG